MGTYVLQALSAFGAGLGTSLSPCVYPMIPITVGYLGSASAGGKKKILGFVTGQVIAFTLLGIVGVLLGELLGFSSQIPWVQVATGVLLLYFAYVSYFDRLPAFLYRLGSGRAGNSDTAWGAFLVGISSAAVMSPCTSPVVGGVLAAVAQVEERVWGMSLMFFFSLGLVSLFLVLGLGFAKASSMPRAGKWMTKVHKASALLLALGGVYFALKGVSGL